MMDKKISKQFDQIEESKRQLLHILKGVDSAKLKAKSNSDSWSILQVVSHLIKIEEGTVRYLNKKLSFDFQFKRVTLMSSLKFKLLNFSLQLPIKLKTSKILEETTNKIALEDAITKWDDVRTEMKSIFEKLSNEQLNASFFKNIAAGRISIYQQMSFIQIHLRRHIKQIEGIIRDFGN